MPLICYNNNKNDILSSVDIIKNDNESKVNKILAKERILAETLSINSRQYKKLAKNNIVDYVSVDNYGGKIPVVNCKYSFEKGLEI